MSTETQTPSPEPIMQFFAYAHLPQHLQEVSRPWCELAEHVVATVPRNAERSVALRKLLEGKDAAVRAVVALRKLLEGKDAAVRAVVAK